MARISFPDVPFSRGVPNVPRAITGVAAKANIPSLKKYDLFGIWDSALNKWQVTGADGNPVLVPDTIISFHYKGSAKSATHPVEPNTYDFYGKLEKRGSFASYNKIANPYEIQIRMAFANGTWSGKDGIATKIARNASGREDAVARLEDMKNGLELYDIVTPDAVYRSCSLEGYEYRRDSGSGVSMIIAECFFSQVRQTAVAGGSPKKDSGHQVKGTGRGAAEPILGSLKSKIESLQQRAESTVNGKAAVDFGKKSGGSVWAIL
jgi:hypothetical protein